MSLDRRRFLSATGTGLIGLLAGCQSGGTTDGQDSVATTDAGTTAPQTTLPPTETGTETTTDSQTEEATTTSDPEELKRRAREFVALLDDGSFEAAHERFNSTAASQISQSQLERVWSGLEQESGAFQSLSAMETTRRDGSHVVTGTVEFERARPEFVLSFGSDGITGFRIRPRTSDWSAPSYADESAFTEREVSLVATDGCSLGGTLTVPEGAADVPGVVLVHGQGPSDRDGTVGPNRPYKDLAWGLASRGVAVLRYDKRTQACDVDLAEITIDDAVTEDALTAVDALRGTDAVADDDVIVAGHSIGATLAPRIAARDGDLAGVVMLAPLARSASEAILDQNQYLAERDGTVTDAEEELLAQVRGIVEQIRSLDFPDEETVYLGGDEYWRTLREYDHLETAQELDLARLILQGGRDYQVTVEDDFAQWRDAIGDDESVEFQRYPKLNHLFMPGSGKPGREEYFDQNHVAEAVVADLASFADEAAGN
ncbi:alpha/beta hydrolase [Halorussus litoreus]|uniref:alpha/beta hydrolase n=1 Tax=Halorussus litoreus TaxID=1710536 RepID=UPI000E2546DA|nr:alpha/beta fold hydrolase [Halorussus litoreus]